MGQEVYRATEFDILALNPNISAQHPPHAVEGHLLALIRSHLKSSFLLLSYGWDLTTRLQAQWATQESSKGKALWETVSITDRLSWIRLTFSSGRRQILLEQVRDTILIDIVQRLIANARFLQTRLIDATANGQSDVSKLWTFSCYIVSFTFI